MILRVEIALYSLWLKAVNVYSHRPITGSCDVDVSITTYGQRTRRVWKTIESIGRGRVRPRMVVLWHEDLNIVNNPPVALRRLLKRGLVLRHCLDYGPHKKYFPYLLEEGVERVLVTADDDVYYPKDWLADLVAVYQPDQVIAYRAHRMTDDPYLTWPPCDSTEPSEDLLATGVSGVMYPPVVLRALRERGDEFMHVCPRADDFWLHYAAVASGIPTRQVRPKSSAWWPIRPKELGLWAHNQTENDSVSRAVRTSWLSID